MGEQNLILKRKLVIQSFLPLFILIFIRYFDYRMISSICHFIRELMQRNFSVMNRIWDHPYLWSIYRCIHFTGMLPFTA